MLMCIHAYAGRSSPRTTMAMVGALPPSLRARAGPGDGGHHQRPGLRQGAVISDAHPSRTTGHPSPATGVGLFAGAGERGERRPLAGLVPCTQPVIGQPPEIDALFSSCGPPRRPARARPANPPPEWGVRGPGALPSGGYICLANEIPPPGRPAAVRQPGCGGSNGALMCARRVPRFQGVPPRFVEATPAVSPAL